MKQHDGNVWKNTIILLQLLFVVPLMSVFMVAALNGKHMIDMDNRRIRAMWIPVTTAMSMSRGKRTD